jgi:hypothetical protein
MGGHGTSRARPLAVRRHYEHFTQGQDSFHGSPEPVRFETVVIGYQDERWFHSCLMLAGGPIVADQVSLTLGTALDVSIAKGSVFTSITIVPVTQRHLYEPPVFQYGSNNHLEVLVSECSMTQKV